MALHAHRGVGRDMALLGFGKCCGLRQPAEDRLHHDHGGVHDQSEIDGADRQQVGGFAAQHQNDHGKEQRERNRGADDQRAAEIAEENPLQQHDQQDADHHVVQHGRGRDVDQILAVVDALDPHARRQDAGIVDRCHQLLDAQDRRRTLLAAAHQHDALHDIVVLIEAGDAEPRFLADRDGRDVLDQNRIAAALRHHGVGEVVDRPDQPDAADHRRLRADVDGIAADIDVGIADGLQQLRQRQAVGDQLVEVDLQLVGLGLAAPAGDIDHARHGAEAALQNPVLQRLEVEHAVIRRSDQPVAVDFADRAERRNPRLHVARQRRHLRQPVQHLLQRLVIGVVERKLQFDVRQAVQRDGADRAQILDAGNLGLDRDRDVAFDLFRRQARTLRHDVDHRRCRIGIGFDIELLERNQAADQYSDEQAHHQIAAADGNGD